MKVSLVFTRLVTGGEYITRGFISAEKAEAFHLALVEHLKKRPVRFDYSRIANGKTRRERVAQYEAASHAWNNSGPTPGQYMTASGYRLDNVEIEE